MSTRVCSIDDVEPDSSIRIDIDGHRLAVVRCGDDVYVIGDRCTHADISLAEGEVDPDECTIECWKHGSEFRLSDGQPETLPATQPTPTYAVQVDGDGNVMVELDDER
ncbi:MAG: non-heme iron oxygenase ferredoxin subunit [Acidimicrobiales bacterium]|nr:non-heme iron oxygenase ferredoxin subunit [Acidimicrobiales bacterium]